MGRSLLLLLLLSSDAFAGETSWDMRLRFSPVHPDAISPGLRYEGELRQDFPYTFAAQLAFSPKEVRQLNYQAGVGFLPWPILKIESTLFHSVLPTVGAGSTGLTAKAAFDIPISWGTLDWFGTFGWYERLSQAAGISILPLPSGGSEREHDFLFRFGFRYHFSDKWRTTLEAASYDEYEVYNLNGPFFQGAVENEIRPGDTWRAYARYQMLLGFGRPSELAFGGEIRFYR